MDVHETARASRSWLFTPATRPERFAKAAQIGADVLIIDLEDAVAPDEKAAARQTALTYLSRPEPAACSQALRINALDTHAGITDMDALLTSGAAPDYLVLPKTDSAAHLQILDRLLAAAKRPTRLVGLIESARGLAAVEAIAAATPRLSALMLGAADMAADLGAASGWAPLAYARSRLVLACTLAGITPIDSPSFDIRDAEVLSRAALDAVAFGFLAKAAIHPGQVAAINRALTPTPEALRHAEAVLVANAKGVGVVDGRMIDAAVARQARRVLAAGRTAALSGKT